MQEQLKNVITKTINSIESQKLFHLKNIGNMTNSYDAKEYVEMMKEDYMVSFFIRNQIVLKEYNKTFSKNILTENKYEAKLEINDFFDFIKKSSLLEMGLYDQYSYKKIINKKTNLVLESKNSVDKLINKNLLSEQWARLKDPIGYWKGLYNQLKAAGIGVKWEVANNPAKSTFMYWGGWVIWKNTNTNGGYPISFTDKASGVNVAFRFVDYGGKYAGQAANAIKIYPKTGTDTTFNLGQFGKLSNSQMSATFKKYSKTAPKKKAPAKEKSLLDQGLDFAGKVVDKGTELVKKGVEVVSPYITKVLDSQFAYFIPGLSAVKLGYDAKKVYDNWEKIKKMTLEDWVEVFRNFLNGSVGIAIQIVLALTGKGHVINLIAWGLLFQYDWYYQGLMKGNFNWYNILTSLIGLIGTGAAAGVTSGAKAVLSSIKTVDALVPALAKAAPKTPSITTKLLPTLEKITTLGATIIGKVTNALNWLVSKIPLIGKLVKPLQNGIKSINTLISKITDGIKTYFKKGAGQNLQVGSHAHFDLPSLAKKLTALGDKTITKKVVGKVTKIIYKVLVGDTLQKILNKYEKSGVTADIVKQLNTGINLSKLTPGTELRLA
jgi:hypothetical protein